MMRNLFRKLIGKKPVYRVKAGGEYNKFGQLYKITRCAQNYELYLPEQTFGRSFLRDRE